MHWTYNCVVEMNVVMGHKTNIYIVEIVAGTGRSESYYLRVIAGELLSES